MTAHHSSQVIKCSQCLAISTSIHIPSLALQSLTDPRDSFRLLTLDAGSADEPLSANLCEARRSSGPVYKCLSYTWSTDPDVVTIDSPTSTDLWKPITVNGQIVAITNNLWCALRAIRRRDLRLCIWVDALCIRQDDDVEKSQQVQMIGATFSNASHVLCWVTEDDVFSELFQSLWHEPATQNPSPSTSTRIRWPGPDQHGWASYNTRMVNLLCNMRYFTRSWILQELILPDRLTVICGSASIEDWAFEQMVNSATNDYIVKIDPAGTGPGSVSIQKVDTSKLEYVRQIFRIRTEYKQTMKLPHSIWYFLSTFHESRCRDPRDKLYSLLSLVEGVERYGTLLESDYQIDVATLYLGLAWSTYSEGNVEAIQIMWQLLRSLDLPDKELVAVALFENVSPSKDKTAYSAFRRSLIEHVFFVSNSSWFDPLDLPKYIGRQLLDDREVYFRIHMIRFLAWIEAARIRVTAVLLYYFQFGGSRMFWLLAFVYLLHPFHGRIFDALGVHGIGLHLTSPPFYCFTYSVLFAATVFYILATTEDPSGKSWKFEAAHMGSTMERPATRMGSFCISCFQKWHKQARPKQAEQPSGKKRKPIEELHPVVYAA